MPDPRAAQYHVATPDGRRLGSRLRRWGCSAPDPHPPRQLLQGPPPAQQPQALSRHYAAQHRDPGPRQGGQASALRRHSAGPGTSIQVSQGPRGDTDTKRPDPHGPRRAECGEPARSTSSSHRQVVPFRSSPRLRFYLSGHCSNFQNVCNRPAEICQCGRSVF